MSEYEQNHHCGGKLQDGSPIHGDSNSNSSNSYGGKGCGRISVPLTKVCASAMIPCYASEGAAGADLYALLEPEGHACTLQPGETALVRTGIRVAIPCGYVGLVYARSGLATKRGLAPANKVGVIDSDYRGEILVSLYNQSNLPQTINPGERVAQLVIAPVLQADFCPMEALDDTVRGQGGFGSTGA